MVLRFASTDGWRDSSINVSVYQSHFEESCVYNGNCNMHGENLLGRCFCVPGWTGATCQKITFHPMQCSNHDDRCFYTEDGGVWLVSTSRWKMALEAESSTWNAAAASSTGDRVSEHMSDFNEYKSVGPTGTNLGAFIEVGAGPWTQSLPMIHARKFQVERYVLLEPNAINYASMVRTSPYRHGSVEGIDEGKLVVINAGAEQLDLMPNSFDTLMIINVLEHVQNAIKILRNVYNALKPGGLLIFSERWWDNYRASEHMDLDTLYHPIRIKKCVITTFLSGFESIYEIRDRESKSYSMENRNFNGTYFIGRKKKIC
jgi:SAM-dependent methyltransferase